MESLAPDIRDHFADVTDKIPDPGRGGLAQGQAPTVNCALLRRPATCSLPQMLQQIEEGGSMCRQSKAAAAGAEGEGAAKPKSRTRKKLAPAAAAAEPADGAQAGSKAAGSVASPPEAAATGSSAPHQAAGAGLPAHSLQPVGQQAATLDSTSAAPQTGAAVTLAAAMEDEEDDYD